MGGVFKCKAAQFRNNRCRSIDRPARLIYLKHPFLEINNNASKSSIKPYADSSTRGDVLHRPAMRLYCANDLRACI
jgi:hypothetical protein